ncbi:pseudouridine synthase [Streptococcus catagoni]|uniref:pseudouridine synthase n=1 Tax=Streptococcus catagoni TaxID=2654874 RepID=UPI0014097E66|nr:pseudouridine synthase [Streptococcus catagoni]
MRLDKFLVEAGLGSRNQVKTLLKKKAISINGKIESSPKVHIKENEDQICYNGEQIHYEKFLYYMLNKPKGVLSAREDKSQKTVLDLLDEKAFQKSVFPVGRLDKDTHGLLLLTNNGDLAHRLLSPKKHVEKEYMALVSGIMTAEDAKAFTEGIVLKDFTCQAAKLEILEVHKEDNLSKVKITLKEGKYHQVKRMVKACGKEVIDLQRISMGPLELDSNLEKGQYRPLTEAELLSLSTYCDHL